MNQPPSPSPRPQPPVAGEYDFDVIVVGSGFGGAVSALRLSEKGYRVAVIEAGRRFAPGQLPKSSWDLRNYLWAPAVGLYGIQRIHLLRDVIILAGAGVGGGSLNYANTLYVPPTEFFTDPQWGHITDWHGELAPHYNQAQRMLGARLNPTVTPADRHLKDAAAKMGVADSFHMAPVGVFFGDGQDSDGSGRARPGDEVADPYFGGAGPARRACTECGECMTGCRHGAKNMLTENYLYLAERHGAEIRPLTTVTRIQEHGDGYRVETQRTGARRRRPSQVTARHVVIAAGTWGTQELLHSLQASGDLPRISGRLGHLTRTNSEALVGAQTTSRRYGRPPAFNQGVAITSSIHPDDSTHIEPVRYGKGSNAMGLLAVLQVPAGRGTGGRVPGRSPKWLRFALAAARHPMRLALTLDKRHWSERVIIGLVMQSLDNSLTVSLKKTWRKKARLTSRPGHGAPNPTSIPAGEEAARLLAAEINGVPAGTVGDIFDVPMTAHFIGGCPIGDSPRTGVVDPYHRLYGHPGISVVDGSAIPANPGVNPSLTITAQAERAMSLWPNKGQPDPRPAQGEPYRVIQPVRQAHPAVPAGAFAALRDDALLLPEPRLRPGASG